jgi:hypothetical protein
LPIVWWSPVAKTARIAADASKESSTREQERTETVKTGVDPEELEVGEKEIEKGKKELEVGKAEREVERTEPEVQKPEPAIKASEIQIEVPELVIGEFVGQGRRLRHCGVTNTVLDRIEYPKVFASHRDGKKNSSDAPEFGGFLVREDQSPSIPAPRHTDEEKHSSATDEPTNRWSQVLRRFRRVPAPSTYWYDFNDINFYKALSSNFEGDIVYRPRSWWVCWLCGGAFVSIGVSMAMAVSFRTPPVGLGCAYTLDTHETMLASTSDTRTSYYKYAGPRQW